MRLQIIHLIAENKLDNQRGKGGDKQQQQRFIFDGVSDHLNPVFPKNNGDGYQRAHMKKNVKQELVFDVHAKQRLEQVQVTA